MKYLALLRDSFREALDSKVIYFTFGLSGLLILFLLSISYRPVTVREEVELACSKANLLFSMQASGPFQQRAATCEVIKFHQTQEDSPPWESDYQFTVQLTMPKNMVDSQHGKQNLLLAREFVRETLRWARDVVVNETTKVEFADPVNKDQAPAPPKGNPEDKDKKGNADNKAKKEELQITEFSFSTRGSKVDELAHWQHEASLFFGLLPMSWFRSSLTHSVRWIEDALVNGMGGWVILLIGVIITASFIPNMLQKGSLDLLVVKPISRVGLLLFKYLGGLAFVFVNSAVAVGGVWLMLGLRTGIWTYGFLLVILVITFFFAVLYAVSVLFGVLTRSTVLCIFVTFLVWFFLFGIGVANAILNPQRPEIPMVAEKNTPPVEAPQGPAAEPNPALKSVANVIYVIHTALPRTNEFGELTTYLISNELFSDEERRATALARKPWYKWAESLGVSLAFIAVMLGLACWRFAAHDY